MHALLDRYGRRISYLRLSVTDRCNLRCLYCMPAAGCSFAPPEALLRDAEVLAVARVMAGLGVTRLRLTGGEPLLRRGLVTLIEQLAALPGVEELALSTNGVMLARAAYALRAAGLTRVNVSLDSLDAETFRRITRRGEWADVWRGIWTALEVGLSPVKLNVVVLRGINDEEIPRFADLSRAHPLHVRFIELMPRGGDELGHAAHFVPIGEVRAICERRGALEPAADVAGAGPAAAFRYAGARGTVGFIGALTCGFCARCNRLRLSADGVVRPCLDHEMGVDLRAPLRAGASDAELASLVRAAVAMKPVSHAMRVGWAAMAREPMCAIGG